MNSEKPLPLEASDPDRFPTPFRGQEDGELQTCAPPISDTYDDDNAHQK